VPLRIRFDGARVAAALQAAQGLRPGEVCGTVTAELDPLRHLRPHEREAVLSSIVPAKDIAAVTISTHRFTR
jgi:hypothetical protein